ncbi:MAG: exodeoxyribonuclease VII large subunit [Sedimentisphaerales bacterium]|nr:exodeoxyribonuclease VII large subunit [Sedimentisphaerales bacterium]
MPQSEFRFSDSFFETDRPARQSPRPPAQPKATAKATKTAKASKAAKAAAPAVLNVTQLTRLIKLALNERFAGTVLVTGEISNCKRHNSGHLYLTLKDDQAQIAAVMWRSQVQRLKFQPLDGMAVLAAGRIDVYEPQGKYQLYLDSLEPAGAGALDLAFRQLAEKLRAEGLFDDRHKKPLPPYPQTIAIVTSPTGAVIQDISQTLRRRYPIVRTLLYPVAVQGDAAARQIAAALGWLNRNQRRWGGIDLIILARGGGSLEDLWPFNEEPVARAVFASAIPVLSGIGHEVDTTIADLVADRRAATPTAAAELAVPLLTDLIEQVARCRRQLVQGLHQRLEPARQLLRQAAGRPFFARPGDWLGQYQQQLDERQTLLQQRMGERLHQTSRRLERDTTILRRIEPHQALRRARTALQELTYALRRRLDQTRRRQANRLDAQAITLRMAAPARRLAGDRERLILWLGRCQSACRRRLERQTQQLDHLSRRLDNLNPRAVLARGYSITRRRNTGQIVRADSVLAAEEILATELSDHIVLESRLLGPPRRRKDEHGKDQQ